MNIAELNALVEGICPITGINSNGDISFKDEATASQKKAAQKVVDDNLSSLGTDSPAAIIKVQIASLESQQTPRRIREAMASDAGKAWLASLDTQIAALRAQL